VPQSELMGWSSPQIAARFDDLRATPGHTLRFERAVGSIEARCVEDVDPALVAVEDAAARGLWAAGYLAYEAAPGLDPTLPILPRDPADPFAPIPLVWFGLFEAATQAPSPEPGADDLSRLPSEAAWTPSIRRSRYDRSIERIHEYIAAGDTYQVNYTMRLRSAVMGSDAERLYEHLCLAQRGSYGAYLNIGRYSILSASPELFFRIDGRRITTRPMKGTSRRGRWSEEDDAAVERLQSSAKERAENAMIVDLLRNDLGRIARTGTVRVPRLFEPERYETVWQLTSTVVAELPDEAGLHDVLRALFPSGSVTGAPKVRTMEIIAELEDSPRGIYTGAIGYLAPPQASDPRALFNVAIRTVVLDTESGAAEYGVGGGITFDSVAAAEFDEVLAKARVLSERRPGFALTETLRFDPGTGFAFVDDHLHRLSRSARYFGFAERDDDVRRALELSVAGVDRTCAVRLVLRRDGTVNALVGPALSSPDETLRLAIDDERVDRSDPFLYHKTTSRERHRRAIARHPHADDVILVNDRDEVTETTTSNLVVLLRDRWWTPPLDAGLLPGIARGAALSRGDIAERPITVNDLLRADAIEVMDSVRGSRPATLRELARR
jgi:para-aminobenzoate synthetase / 4-amino-4-deoxychorismate lyase